MLIHLSLLMLALAPPAQAPIGRDAPRRAEERDPVAIMARLSDLELAPDDAHSVRDLTLRRDVLTLSFSRGVLAFLEPVDGRVTGAVYVGSGSVLAIPPDEVERGQMDRFTGTPILNERFDAAILRFTDDTYREVLGILDSRASEQLRVDDLEALLPWRENLGETSRFVNFRLLQDLLGRDDRPIFLASLRGESLGWFDVAFDQRRVEEVAIGGADRTEAGFPVRDIWASFNQRSGSADPSAQTSKSDAEVDVVRYEIDTSIAPGGALTSVAGISMRARHSGERVLEFSITPRLRVTEVRFAGEPVRFFQHPPDASPAPGSRERFVVVLPRATRENEELHLTFSYAGQVLVKRGDGMYYVSERVLWYPHVGILDPASYELTFHYPSENVLVATGDRLGEWESGGLKHSTWASGTEYVVAGFNYGDFSVESDESGRVPVYVHVNNDVGTVFEELSAQRAAVAEAVLDSLRGLWGRLRPPARFAVLPDYDLFSTRRLAGNIVGQVRSIVDFFSGRLGDYPFERLSVSQVPVPFSQGWPSLLYVSTLAFFDQEQSARLGLSEPEPSNTEYVLAHEIAHQWFGNEVSWRSYRDQWVSEGFANYMALLYLDELHGETGDSRRILENLRRRLLAESSPGRTYDDNGPVWLGQRLTSASAPDGYGETVYPKATWIVHMLRMLMRDESSLSDERFFSMLRDYLDQYAGRPASTLDLKAMAERYMTPRMDPDGGRTLDWFFTEWVFGTGVPDYGLSYEVVAGPGSGFSVRGAIADRAGLGFTVPLPVYARTRSGGESYLGDVVVSGDTADFEFQMDNRPAAVLLDPYRSVLRK